MIRARTGPIAAGAMREPAVPPTPNDDVGDDRTANRWPRSIDRSGTAAFRANGRVDG
jgi:hypothetical protein